MRKKMSLDLSLMTNYHCDQSVVRLNRAYAVREWFISRIGIPQNGHGTIPVTKELLSELLESCNEILADRTKSESLIPISQDFCEQYYDNDYFDQILDAKKQLDSLFTTWNGKKPLYYYEWY
jgi:hypothetical protein